MKKYLLLLFVLFCCHSFAQDMLSGIHVYMTSYSESMSGSSIEIKSKLHLWNTSGSDVEIDYLYAYNTSTGNFFFVQNGINKMLPNNSTCDMEVYDTHIENQLYKSTWGFMIRYRSLSDGVYYVKSVTTILGYINTSEELPETGSHTGIRQIEKTTARTGGIYSIYGIKESAIPRKGIYIQNGKKVLVN